VRSQRKVAADGVRLWLTAVSNGTGIPGSFQIECPAGRMPETEIVSA
jgi:hypothetical protein